MYCLKAEAWAEIHLGDLAVAAAVVFALRVAHIDSICMFVSGCCVFQFADGLERGKREVETRLCLGAIYT